MSAHRSLPFVDEAIRLLGVLSETQADAIEQASQWCADASAADGLVHLFGTGHSRMPVEEMFPRYGSYPGFNPIAELSMTFHTQVVGANGQRQAMFIERMPGLAEVILDNFAFGPKDVLIVFSAGGTTAVPVGVAVVVTDAPPSVNSPAEMSAMRMTLAPAVGSNRLMWQVLHW